MLRVNLTLIDGLLIARSENLVTDHKYEPDLKVSTVMRPHRSARRNPCPPVRSAGPKETDGPSTTSIPKNLLELARSYFNRPSQTRSVSERRPGGS